MKVISGVLPTTATYPKEGQRHYQFVSPARGDNGVEYLALVTITQKKETDAYFLEPYYDEKYPFEYHSFIWARQTGEPTADRPMFYQTVFTADLTPVSCTCTGAKTQRQAGICKHRDCLTDLFAKGVFGPVEAEQPAA